MILYLCGKLIKDEPINMVARLSTRSIIGDALFVVNPNEKFFEIDYKKIYQEMKENGLIEIG